MSLTKVQRRYLEEFDAFLRTNDSAHLDQMRKVFPWITLEAGCIDKSKSSRDINGTANDGMSKLIIWMFDRVDNTYDTVRSDCLPYSTRRAHRRRRW